MGTKLKLYHIRIPMDDNMKFFSLHKIESAILRKKFRVASMNLNWLINQTHLLIDEEFMHLVSL